MCSFNETSMKLNIASQIRNNILHQGTGNFKRLLPKRANLRFFKSFRYKKAQRYPCADSWTSAFTFCNLKQTYQGPIEGCVVHGQGRIRVLLGGRVARAVHGGAQRAATQPRVRGQ